MGKGIEAHIKIAIAIGCVALAAVSFLAGGIPKIQIPHTGILGLSVAGEEASSSLSSAASQMTLSEQLLLLLYLVAAVVVAYCLVGLIDSCLSYLHDPELYHIRSYMRKGVYHGYAPHQIARRLREQGWNDEKVAKAVQQVFAKK